MTEKLYYADAYLKKFEATVLACKKNGDFYDIILDKTAFCPEGGGQGADTGIINGIKIIDVQECGEEIVHKAESAINVDEKVSGEIDWDLRYSKMQSHSGEHIVSGIVHSMFGYTNSGFHMNESTMTVDFSGPLSLEDIEKVELECNKAIYKNAVISSSFPSKEDAENLSFRSKLDIDSGLRLITIDGIDCCACCAPHVKQTGEIGIIKILEFAPHRQGTRVEMTAGINALKDYLRLSASNKALMKLLSTPRYEVKDAVIKQNEALNEFKTLNQNMSKRLALAELKTISVGNNLYSISKDLSYDDLRHCANTIIENGTPLCVLFSKSTETDYFYVVSSDLDVSDIVKTINTTLNGKGGGRGNYAQGKVTVENESILIEAIENILK